MLTNAADVAEYFIHIARKESRGISNKKLQKLVYYAQAWALVLIDKPLFSEKFEAWIHGPAIPSLYRKFKKYGYQPVESQNTNFDVQNLPHTEILDEVWRIYGKYDANYLEVLTHQEQPWIDAREALEYKQSSSNEISIELMKSYYYQKKQNSSVRNVNKKEKSL